MCLSSSSQPPPPSPLFPYTTLFRSSSISGRNCLQPGRACRVRIRARNEDATEWSVMAQMGNVSANQIDIGIFAPNRSEEHTSELQSRFDLVCRLLLEKKVHNSSLAY